MSSIFSAAAFLTRVLACMVFVRIKFGLPLWQSPLPSTSSPGTAYLDNTDGGTLTMPEAVPEASSKSC